MAATTTTLSTLVKPVVANDATIIKYTNREFLKTMRMIGMPDLMAAGDTAFRWKVQRATGNSSVQTFTEGQAVPAAGNQTWVEASLAWTYFRAIVEISGHAVDALGSAYLTQEWTGAGGLKGEIAGAMADLEDQINNTFLGSTGAGILNAIEATGTYAGQARATITDWQSYEEAAGGDALVSADLLNVYEALRDNDRGATEYAALLAPMNQVTNYVALNGPGGTSLVRFVTEAGAPKLDFGYNETAASFMNAKIFAIPDLTDTEILHITHPKTDWCFVTIRPIKEKELSINDDAERRVQISTAGTLVCKNPRRQGKTTNVLA